MQILRSHRSSGHDALREKNEQRAGQGRSGDGTAARRRGKKESAEEEEKGWEKVSISLLFRMTVLARLRVASFDSIPFFSSISNM